MKAFLFLLFAGVSTLLPANAISQAPVALENVCAAIGAGDLDAVVSAMDAEVEMNILGDENLYSRAEAVAKLKAFFAQVTPKGFGKVHQGASKSADAEYCIGTLTTAKGNYTVYVYVAKRGNGVILQELRIEK